MIVCPASMGFVGSLAAGLASDLAERAADVQLKERRPLVLVPRETPLNLIHLRNLTDAHRGGRGRRAGDARLLLEAARRIDDMVNFVVGKVLDVLGVEHDLLQALGRGLSASSILTGSAAQEHNRAVRSVTSQMHHSRSSSRSSREAAMTLAQARKRYPLVPDEILKWAVQNISDPKRPRARSVPSRADAAPAAQVRRLAAPLAGVAAAPQSSRTSGAAGARHAQARAPARTRRDRRRTRRDSSAGPSMSRGGDARIRTGDKGFAGPCLATWPRRRMRAATARFKERRPDARESYPAAVRPSESAMERTTGFEPATPTLARLCSTN